MRLVVVIHVAAERLFRFVKDDREVRRLLLRFHLAQQLPQHIAEAEHGVDLQTVRFSGERRERVIGAKDVGGAVDQVDVVAFFERAALDGGDLGAELRGFGWHTAEVSPRGRIRHLRGALCTRFGAAAQALCRKAIRPHNPACISVARFRSTLLCRS